MIQIRSIHHVAIICGDYEASKKFYTEILGFRVLAEHYRTDRSSWKLDLGLGDRYILELFSFPEPPARVSRPEARGLRHLAFAIDDIHQTVHELNKKGVGTEAVRTDEYTGRRFTFFSDPDGLPLELYEI